MTSGAWRPRFSADLLMIWALLSAIIIQPVTEVSFAPGFTP